MNESDELGCDLGGVVETPDDNTTSPSEDDDGDGVLNTNDDCPDTEAGVATDDKGCSSQQRAALVQDSTDNTAGETAESFFFILMIVALALSGGAFLILRKMRSEAEDVKDSITESDFVEFTATPSEPTWQAPVLDASAPIVTPDMLARVPGWTADMVAEYLKQGWTMDQLANYYQEQVAQHTSPEQH